ncbi:MAG: hypothetical protein KA792_04085 [Bacteroidales bacterium]|nr:hypothetical protein [Bacteroidales bacterium]
MNLNITKFITQRTTEKAQRTTEKKVSFKDKELFNILLYIRLIVFVQTLYSKNLSISNERNKIYLITLFINIYTAK